MSKKEYPYWDKGEINWRLYIAPNIFGAGATKEIAYERTVYIAKGMQGSNQLRGATMPTLEEALEL